MQAIPKEVYYTVETSRKPHLNQLAHILMLDPSQTQISVGYVASKRKPMHLGSPGFLTGKARGPFPGLCHQMERRPEA